MKAKLGADLVPFPINPARVNDPSKAKASLALSTY